MNVPNADQETPLEKFKREDGLVLHVLSFLNVSDVLLFKRVSKKWQGLCSKAIEDNFNPKKEFESNEELRAAAKKYCGGEDGNRVKEDMDEIGRTYGYPINKWKVGKLTDFSYTFYQMHTFNEYIGGWDMSNAKSIRQMFSNARSFNQPLVSWETGQVVTMDSMFWCATSFNQPLNDWDTSKVRRMSYMFTYATSFNQPLDSWSTGSVETMQGMFADSPSFNQIISEWDVSNVEDYKYMFVNATAFQHPLPDGWDQARAFEL